MSEINNFNCEKAKKELDDNFGIGSTGHPSAALRSHLGECQSCHNYQLANRVIIEAARDLPGLTADSALTDSIMAMIDEEIAGQKIEEERPNPASSPQLSTLFDRKSIALMAASFGVFIVLLSGFSTDGLWSAFSWLVALAVVALLKPLIEYNQYMNHNLPKDRMVKA
ncbi:MAG: hypothetical protein KGS72_00810 [Cyanobacteria bacterium REEB67]|nr:hypothetical protein [Cyanobacteria bacterium REEB67]